MLKARSALIAILAAAAITSAAAQQVLPAKRPNRLATAKLIAVTPMPNDFDQWIIQNLRAWNKYKISADPEGADLVVRGEKPEKQPQFHVRGGVEQPKRQREGPAVVSMTVIDWVANQPVWHATIRDKKGTKEQAEPPPGPEVEIFAGGMKPEELAAVLVREFRRYVEQSEQAGSK